jgi:hypothetical protein
LVVEEVFVLRVDESRYVWCKADQRGGRVFIYGRGAVTAARLQTANRHVHVMGVVARQPQVEGPHRAGRSRSCRASAGKRGPVYCVLWKRHGCAIGRSRPARTMSRLCMGN